MRFAFVLCLIPAVALAGMNKNFLVQPFEPCAGPAICPDFRSLSSFTFETAVLRSPQSRYIASGKLAVQVELKGVRDASGALVTTEPGNPADDFKLIVPEAEVYSPGIGVLPSGVVGDVIVRFDLKNGNATVRYSTPDGVVSGLVTVATESPYVIDNQGQPFAATGARAKP